MTPEEIEALSDTMAAIVRENVEAATRPLLERIAALEARKPEKGEPGQNGIDGKDGDKGEPGANGKDGAAGRDGLDVKDLFRAEGGRLVAVMSDGTTKDLGAFVGKDGNDGKDGRDGFSLSDFDATLMENGRTVLLSFDQGDQSFKVELGIPAMIYRGVFRDGQRYEKGDTVTWGGSLWHCDADETTDKPDGGEKHWTLAAKRGRDGKNGTVKPEKAKEPLRVGVPARGA